MICGYLDSEGKFYSCPYYGHQSEARKLVEQYKYARVKPFELNEDVLLRNNWICIRTSDAYKGVYNEDGSILFITDAQQKFFEDHKEEFNERQLADIEDMLRDFGKLYRFHKEDK